MPGLTISYVSLDGLRPADRNPRTHSPTQIRAIERSLQRFGWSTPMGVADGKLIYGHARRQAAMNLRDKGSPIAHNDDGAFGPVVDLSHLTEPERRAYVMADNQLAMLAGWDEALLGLEVRELTALGFDLTPIGFSKVELARLLVEPVGDERPGTLLGRIEITIAEPVHTVSAGDHWILSKRHHLVCASVIEDWPAWRPLLRKGCLFVPYPGPYVPFGHKAADFDLIMVQPDAYAAGHLLDRYAEARGEGEVSLAPPRKDAA